MRPVGYDPKAKAYGMLIVFDESAYLQSAAVPTDVILDNLIAAGAFLRWLPCGRQSQPGSARPRAPCNPDFAEFLHSESCPGSRKMERNARPASSHGRRIELCGLASAGPPFVTRDVRQRAVAIGLLLVEPTRRSGASHEDGRGRRIRLA